MNQLYYTHIAKSIDWVDTFLVGTTQLQEHKSLIDIRRKLKKIDFAQQQKPSATLYGESQVGKSYLVKNLLSVNGESFLVKNPIPTGGDFDFLKNINPDGNGQESTSVVTRFTIDKMYVNEEYPVKISFLSPKDLALIVIDTYFQDYIPDKSEKFITSEEINATIEQLNSKFKDRGKVQDVFSEDDLYDIQEYIEDHFSLKGERFSSLNDSVFWTIGSMFINKMYYNEWFSLIGLIWGNKPVFNTIFTDLIEFLHQLDYPSYVYTNLEAVLKKYGTILDVNRLIQLDKSRFEEYTKDATEGYKSDAVLLLPNGQVVKKDKTKLCAVTQEVIFHLDESLSNSKPFLENIDILDFPGAQPRIELGIEALKNDIGRAILRGKVGFLFNKYASEYLINILLFCNQSRQVKVSYIPSLLNQWITKYIGKNQQERELLLSGQGAEPLFMVYTYFNSDLAKNINSEDSGNKPFEVKWLNRFKKNFQDSIVSPNYTWDTEWTISNPIFQNHYMLRDFVYSEKDGLFKGYFEQKREIERLNPYGDGEYWSKLEKSFVENDYVKKYFKNPQLAWDESATLNNDGSEPIIRNLTVASQKIKRELKLNYDSRVLITNLKNILRNHYHDDVSDDKIRIAINKAKKIHLALDIAFSQNKYFFGKFMRNFIIRENEVFNFYSKKLNEIESIEVTDSSKYHVLIIRNPDLSPFLSYQANMDILMGNYHFQTVEEAEAYFKANGIDLMELFFGNAHRIKNNSSHLATELKKYWFKHFLTVENFKEFIQQGFAEADIAELLNNIKIQFESLKVDEIIAKKIRKYVDRYDKIEELQIMIADISAGTINKFINRMGLDFYSPEKLQEIGMAQQNFNLSLVTNHDTFKFELLEEKDLVNVLEIIENIGNNDNLKSRESIKYFPNFSHYTEWSDLLDVSFVANCTIPTYDLLANTELKKIIDEVESIKN